MGTIAQKFYLGTGNDDGTYGTTIKQLVTTAPGANSATTNTWSSTTASTQTEIPITASSTNSDTSSSNGWAFNDTTGGDALVSTATEQRIIPAGVWSFSMSYTLNSPALLATIACTVTANVYRVSSSGTRTLLFQASSANFSATGTITWNSASQAQYTLGANEVILVGYTATSAATAALVLGAVTNTVLTLNLGTNSFVTLPSPGVRTNYIRSYDATGTGAASVVSRLLTMARSAIGRGEVSFTKAATVAKSFTLVGTGTVSHLKAITQPRTATGTGTVAYTRATIVARSFNLTGTGTVSRDELLIIFLARTISGVGSVAYTKSASVSKSFTVTGNGVITEVHPVQAFRTFNMSGVGVVNGKIELPIDKVPTGSGPSVTQTTIFAILE